MNKGRHPQRGKRQGKARRRPHGESWEERRRRIAEQAERACNLRGNLNGPDLDKGGCTEEPPKAGQSDFA